MRFVVLMPFLFVTIGTASAQDGRSSVEIMKEIVDATQQNLDRIETFSALYHMRSADSQQQSKDGQVHFVWEQKTNRVRSRYVSSDIIADSLNPPGWHAVSSQILYGDGRRLLVDAFRGYLTWPEANERIAITANGEGDNLTYTVRIAYTSDSDEKLFVTWKLSRKFDFNPLLVVRSLGISPETAELVSVSSWSYRKVDEISIPSRVSVCKFEKATGELKSDLTLDLLDITLNDPVSDDAFDPSLPFSISVPDPTPAFDVELGDAFPPST